MATAREEIIGWLALRVADIVIDAGDLDDLAERMAAAPLLAAETFAGEMLDIARILGESARQPVHFSSLGVSGAFDTSAALDAVTLLSAVALAVAIGRIDWMSRPAARDARSILVEQAHRAYAVTARLGPDLHGWLAGLVAVAVRLVSEMAANATPMVTVQTGISLPSTVLAYHLYGDANRAGGMVDMARAATPMVMPATFEALAS